MNQKNEEDLAINLDFLKKINVAYLILGALIIFGFYVRSFHLDYPSIGYHNMKENEYLSQAINQYKYGDYLRRRQHIFGMDEGPGYFEEYPQIPILPWMFLVSWTIFGVHYWAARIIIVLFSVSTIPLIYLITKRLAKNEYLSLLTAALYTIMPLSVFFGRNIQPESPALFFIMLGTYFYLLWLDEDKQSRILYSAAALGIAALFKYTFLIVLIPLAAIFPYNKLIDVKSRMKTIKQLGLFFAITLLPGLVWGFISRFLNTKESLIQGTFGRVSLFRIFTGEYWANYTPIMRAYVIDNYSTWFLWMAILGLALLLLKRKTRLSRFTVAYAIATVPYGMILADYIKAHSYYQMPFIIVVCIGVAYLLYTLGVMLKQATKIRILLYAPLLILLLVVPHLKAATNRQFDTVFFGLDVAGEYIKEHTSEADRFYLIGESQSVAACYVADRRCGFVNFPMNVTGFKLGEKYRNMTWILIHFSRGGYHELLYNRFTIFEYLEQEYDLKQITFFQTQQGIQIQTLILQKGGSSNLTDFGQNDLIMNAGNYRQWSHTYDMKGGQARLDVLEK